MSQQEDHALTPDRSVYYGPPSTTGKSEVAPRSALVAFTSICFILLQSACTAVMAVSGLRLLIGAGSLVFASTGMKFLDSIHADAVRIPMMVLAGAGSAVNLYVVWRIRSLRSRASSSWRTAPMTPEKRRAENIQIALAAITLLLIATEIAAHHHHFGVFYGPAKNRSRQAQSPAPTARAAVR